MVEQAPAVQDAAQALLPFLTDRQFDADKINRFTALCDTLRRDLPQDARIALAEQLRREAPTSDTVRLHSVLFHLTGDLYHLERILHYMIMGGDEVAPELLHYTYWCVSRQMFMGAAAPEKAAAFGPCDVYRFYEHMVRLIARRWGAVPPRREPRPGPIRRVAMVTNQFTGDRHQPSRDCFDYAARLQEAGLDVAIINTNMMPLRIENIFIPPMIAELVERYEGVHAIEMFGRHVKMASFTGRAFSREKMHDVIEAIDGYDPDVLVTLGGSVIAADLFAEAGARPVVTLPTTSGLTFSLAHIVLGYDEHDHTQAIPALYRTPFAQRFRPFSFGFTLPPSAGAGGDFGLGGAGFVFAVVGTRLDQEVDAGFLSLAEEVLDRCPDAVVAFAGPVSELPGRLTASRHAARLRVLGHLNDIRAFYGRVGAFLNPPRQGGGGSAAFAVGEGVPVVTMPWGDVASVAGPDFRVADRAAYVARAAALCADRDFRAAQSALAKARYDGVVDRRHSVQRLLDYCEEARRLAAAGVRN